ncbi:hypothetical protein [Nitrospira sp. Ecomares 2.1]
MSNLILGKFVLENLYYLTLPEEIDRMPSKILGLMKMRFQRLIRRNFYSIGRLVEKGKSAVLIGSESLIKVGESGDDHDRKIISNLGWAAEDVAMVKTLIQPKENKTHVFPCG